MSKETTQSLDTGQRSQTQVHEFVDGDCPGGRKHYRVGDLRVALGARGRRLGLDLGLGVHRAGAMLVALVFANLGARFPSNVRSLRVWAWGVR